MKPPTRPSAPAPAPSSSTPKASTPRSWPPGNALPKDEAGSFIASQERSDVVHDLLAYLAKKMQEMNPARSKFEKQLAKEKTQAEKSPAKLKRPEFACEADARKEEN